jgi:hypothetical protein
MIVYILVTDLYAVGERNLLQKYLHHWYCNSSSEWYIPRWILLNWPINGKKGLLDSFLSAEQFILLSHHPSESSVQPHYFQNL